MQRTLLFLLLFSLSLAARAATLITDATVLTLHPGDGPAFEGHVLFDETGILAVGPGAYDGPTPDAVIDGAGRIVMPGFVSGHNHLWQSALRGIAPEAELYDWLGALHWTYGGHFGEGDFYAFTLHGALDQLRRGITTTYNHSQRLGATEAHYLESLTASYDAGQHFLFSYNPDLNESEAAITEAVDRFVAQAQSVDNSLLLGVSLNSVGSYRDDPAKFALEMALAKRHGMTVQIHYLEAYARRHLDRRKWPKFVAAGAVAPNVSYAHFIHPSPAILAEAVEAGAAMIWNPLSNGRLGSGLADIPAYLEAGLRVGMGVDGAASADIADPFENLRMGLYALRMRERSASVLSPLAMLRLHTLATAEVLGVADEVGSLAVGKRADLLIVDPGRPGTGYVSDAAATLVLACNAANIEAVYVDGRRVVTRGVVAGHDTDALQAEVARRAARIVAAAQATANR